jgi:hypothetical protein
MQRGTTTVPPALAHGTEGAQSCSTGCKTIRALTTPSMLQGLKIKSIVVLPRHEPTGIVEWPSGSVGQCCGVVALLFFHSFCRPTGLSVLGKGHSPPPSLPPKLHYPWLVHPARYLKFSFKSHAPPSLEGHAYPYPPTTISASASASRT